MAIGGWNPDAAGKLLDDFEANLARRRGEGTEQLLRVPIRLFRQCVRAYICKVVDLAAMGCRATIENAGYAILTHRRTSPHGWAKIPAGEPDRSALYTPDEWMELVPLGGIIRQLRNRGILRTDLAEMAFAIKEHGDAVAHFEAQSDRAFMREMGKSHSQPYVTAPPYVDEAGVLLDLQRTANILLELVSWDIAEGQKLAGR